MSPGMRRLLPVAAAALLSACGSFFGPPDDKLHVRAVGPREAVEALLELYAAPETLAARASDRDRLLGRAPEFASSKRKGEYDVDVALLGRAVEAEGLMLPDGVKGRPAVSVSFNQAVVQRAAAADLAKRGYDVQGGGAQGSVAGAVSVFALDDRRLAGLFGARARIDGKVTGAGEPLPLEVEAEAFDVTPEGAAERALENAGMIAAETARRKLSEKHLERVELSIIVENLHGRGQLLRFMRALRAEPGLAAASLGAVLDKDAKVRVWAERMSADELAARLLRLKDYGLLVRAVDGDLGQVEVVEAGTAPEA